MAKNIDINQFLLYLHGSAAFQTIHAGVELGILEAAQNKKLTLEEIATEAGFDSHSNLHSSRILAFGLTGIDLLTKEKGTYQSSAVVEQIFKDRKWKRVTQLVSLQAELYSDLQNYVELLQQGKPIGLKKLLGKGERLYKGETNLEIEQMRMCLHGAGAFQMLRAGAELGVFDLLHGKKLSKEYLAIGTNVHETGFNELLSGLEHLGLVIKDGDGLYRNCNVINEFFKRNEWDLIKKWIAFEAHIVYPGQIDYIESLQQQKNVGLRRIPGEGDTLYERLKCNPKLQKIFYEYMEAYSEYAISHLLDHEKTAPQDQKIGFAGAREMLDCAGGFGYIAGRIVQEYNTHVTVLDLPDRRKRAEDIIRERGYEGRITFHPADMFKEKFPNNQDIISFNHVLMIWNPDEQEHLLRETYDALRSEGAVLIFSAMADDNEKGSVMAALDSVYFRAVTAENGMVYPAKDYKNALEKVRFTNVREISLNTFTPHKVVVANRPS